MKIAIIDHDNHSLFVEDIDPKVLERYYDNDEQAYIDDNYDLENYSWDYIVSAQYIDADPSSAAPFDIDFEKVTY